MWHIDNLWSIFASSRSFDEEEAGGELSRDICACVDVSHPKNNFLLRSTACVVASGMVTWVILELITSAYMRVKGHGDRARRTRGNKRRGKGGTGLSLEPRAAKTLVYSNDRGLLFGRIPSLNRFTSSPYLPPPSLSLFLLLQSYSLCRDCLLFLLLSVVPSQPRITPSWRHSSLAPQLFLSIFRRVVIAENRAQATAERTRTINPSFGGDDWIARDQVDICW